ncbi:MAG: HD domain-containing protein [Deltaproteobacteria bacterium]|jgi:putative hydrolase of HD superfamily|nr:HD domain-containing protein [Deltaproteobacteria bacterium]
MNRPNPISPLAAKGAGQSEPPAQEEAEKNPADFIFEAASLRRTPRSGYQFLGRGHESVAEHSFGATVIAYTLGRLAGLSDLGRLLTMTLFHDLGEARCGDLNYVNKRYVVAREEEAFSDAIGGLSFEDDLSDIRREWKQGESLAAKLAADADQLDMMAELHRLAVHGWSQAEEWLFFAEKRLQTEPGRYLARRILETDPDGWWFERREELWVNPVSPVEPNKPANQGSQLIPVDLSGCPFPDPSCEPAGPAQTASGPASGPAQGPQTLASLPQPAAKEPVKSFSPPKSGPKGGPQ